MSGSSYLGFEDRRLEEDKMTVSYVPSWTRLTEYYAGHTSRLPDEMFRHLVLILRPTRRPSGEPTCRLVGSAFFIYAVLGSLLGHSQHISFVLEQSSQRADLRHCTNTVLKSLNPR
jgi:hypothetical protein